MLGSRWQLLLEALSTDAAREDFRHGRRGAVTLTDAQLDSLTKLHKLISPSRGQGQSRWGAHTRLNTSTAVRLDNNLFRELLVQVSAAEHSVE